jgi:phosphoglycerate dehydrogenase-like enzyme
MKKPLVAVVDWKPSPRGDKNCRVERAAIGKKGTVKYFLCDKEEDWKGEVLKADYILLWHNTNMPDTVINKLENCKAIIRMGTGYDSVEHLTAATRDIPVCNVPDYGTEEVADHSIALSLALCRQIIPTDQECKKLGWEIPNKEKIRRFNTMNFGVVGLGRIGTSVALKAKALGFAACFYDPYLANGVDKSLGISRYKDWDMFLKHMDVISINCPLTEETHHMFTTKEFEKMNEDSFIINTARGSIIKKNDLFKALRKDEIAGAALDVIEDEPLKTKEEAKTPNLIVTCHSGFYSVQAAWEMRHKAAAQVRDMIVNDSWHEIENCINCHLLPRNFMRK